MEYCQHSYTTETCPLPDFFLNTWLKLAWYLKKVPVGHFDAQIPSHLNQNTIYEGRSGCFESFRKKGYTSFLHQNLPQEVLNLVPGIVPQLCST